LVSAALRATGGRIPEQTPFGAPAQRLGALLLKRACPRWRGRIVPRSVFVPRRFIKLTFPLRKVTLVPFLSNLSLRWASPSTASGTATP
jgi:hypothetical protein